MKKTIISVFSVLIVVGIAFVAYQLIFNNGGLLKTGYNTVANTVNGYYSSFTGDDDAELMGVWGGSSSVGADTSGNIGDIEDSTFE